MGEKRAPSLDELLAGACEAADYDDALGARAEVDPARSLHSDFDIAWDDMIGEGAKPEPLKTIATYELARTKRTWVLLGHYTSEYEGTHAVVIRVPHGNSSVGGRRSVAPEHDDEPSGDVVEFLAGTSPHGRATMSWYAYGASLARVLEAGVHVSWDAARFLYAVARPVLERAQGSKRVHGALEARSVRLVLEPFDYLKESWPEQFRLCGASPRAASVAEQRAERAAFAAAFFELTRHPDPAIDALITGAGGAPSTELVAHLRERREPVDALLLDFVAGHSDARHAPRAAAPDGERRTLVEAFFRGAPDELRDALVDESEPITAVAAMVRTLPDQSVGAELRRFWRSVAELSFTRPTG